jgi:four helix bundle protein
MKVNNIVVQKSYAFALRNIKLYKLLSEKEPYNPLFKQLLKSSTSIGANIEEGIGAQSDKDFIAKFSIAYKEARETSYWLRLLRDSQYVEEKLANSIIADCDEILKIVASVLKTMKAKNNTNNF